MSQHHSKQPFSRWLLIAAIPVAFLVGYVIAPNGAPASAAGPAAAATGTIWTCSMHPQVRLNAPGKCPICNMALVPANAEGGADSGAHLTLSPHARAMASVETAVVDLRPLAKEIRAATKIQYNETMLASVTARVDGYVERLYVDYTGLTVEKDDHLVDLYSPELIVAQRELLLALDSPNNTELVNASKTKLRRWEIADHQIEEIMKTRKIQEHLTIYSPVKGTVVEKLVVDKSAVKTGDVLYRLANLDTVWAYLDIYEYEVGWIQYGQRVELVTDAYPGELFPGRITFISPVLDDATRTIKVRVIVDNPRQRLKPGMFAYSVIRVPLLADGKPAPTGVEGLFSCPMHPEIMQPNPGQCSICGMDLTRIPGAAATDSSRANGVLAVPVAAVLDSGTRTMAYVEKAPGEFVPAVVQLGPRAGDYYPVLSGLRQGDRVAVRGNFLIDSQFQIRGLPSLLNPEGDAVTEPHHHGEAAPMPEGHRH